ncbi:MAG: hypothetical protein RLZZ156_1818 [Deinococcota bacterium]|jgi:hypothetical protein
MSVKIWSVGLVAVILASGAVWGATQISSASETRSGHRHSPVLMQQNLPPLLSYVPKYYEHVKPILERSCVGCHSTGNIAPFALETAAQAAPMARTIQKAVQNKYMPPVTAGGATPALLHDKRLSSEEIAIIANWAWAGAPLGKETNFSQAVSSNQKRNPDLVLTPKSEFLPDERLTDEYRCFIFDPKLTEPRFMEAYNIVPANKKIVHHAVIFQIDKSKAESAVQLENKQNDGRLGYPCFGGPGNNLGRPNIIGVWAPGQGAVDYPKGTGTQIQPGDVLVLQMHYNLLAGKGTDQSKAELFFAPKSVGVKRMNSSIILAPVEVPCAGMYPTDPKDPCHREAAYTRAEQLGDETATLFKNPGLLSFCGSTLEKFTTGSTGKTINQCTFPLRIGAEQNLAIYGMLGHMHLLGQSIKLELIRANVAQTVLEIPRWDFHWQSSYWLEKPIDLKVGDQVKITCEFNNTPEVQPEIGGTRIKPRYVVWGEGTVDEMCLGILQIGQK